MPWTNTVILIKTQLPISYPSILQFPFCVLGLHKKYETLWNEIIEFIAVFKCLEKINKYNLFLLDSVLENLRYFSLFNKLQYLALCVLLWKSSKQSHCLPSPFLFWHLKNTQSVPSHMDFWKPKGTKIVKYVTFCYRKI